MSLDSALYLIGVYWPYIAGGLVIGLLTGWFSLGTRKEG